MNDTTTATPGDAQAYAADAALPPAEAGNILAQITRAVADALQAREDVKTAEAALKASQERLRNYEERLIPGLMDEAQQKRLTTLMGHEVERREVIRASIPEARMPEAAMWLRTNGQGSIVKRLLSLQFGKGEDQRAAQAADVLTGAGFQPTDKLSVNHQTLSAAVREMMAEGVNVPADLLGVYVQPIVKITEPKR